MAGVVVQQGQRSLLVGALPDAPLDAAAVFHHDVLPRARAALAAGDDLALVFGPAAPSHHTWRLAVVQELAREATPRRVNGVAGPNGAALGEALEWLATAPGVTGQLLEVDGKNPPMG